MNRLRTIGLLAIALIALQRQHARADFHLWYIQEIFSNYNGSVQFIELFTTSSGQGNLFPAHSISSTSNTFSFPADLPGSTLNKHMLLATPGFGSIPGGATPNYTIPENFFNPAGDTINFGPGVSSHTFGPSNPLPTDGVGSLNYTTFFGNTGSVMTNSPRNQAGAGTSVNVPPPVTTGDYNGDLVVNAADYTLWRNTLGQEVAEDGDGADGDADGEIDYGDFLFWKERYGDVVGGAGAGQGAFSQVPEPTSAFLALAVLTILPGRRVRSSRAAG
jgi:hypothetical protein